MVARTYCTVIAHYISQLHIILPNKNINYNSTVYPERTSIAITYYNAQQNQKGLLTKNII